MKQILLIVLVIGFIAIVAIGLCIDHYRDKKTVVVVYDQYGNPLSSNISTPLIVLYGVIAIGIWLTLAA